MERRYFLPDRVTQSGSQKCTGSGYKNAKNRYPQKTSLPAECILKIHPPHSRDFSRELGGWTLCVLRGFLCSNDQKVLSAKMPSGNIFHTDGVTIFGKEAAA